MIYIPRITRHRKGKDHFFPATEPIVEDALHYNIEHRDLILKDYLEWHLPNKRDRIIVQMALQGYTDDEIGHALDLTGERICQLRNVLVNFLLEKANAT